MVICVTSLWYAGCVAASASEQPDGASRAGRKLRRDLATVYERAQVALEGSDSVAYFAEVSRDRSTSIQRRLSARGSTPFRSFAHDLRLRRPALALQPEIAFEDGDSAYLVLTESHDAIALVESNGDVRVATIGFVRDDRAWKIDHETWNTKPSWMDLTSFLLAQSTTQFAIPSTWSHSYLDAFGDIDALDDIGRIAFTHDEHFLYVRLSFTAVPDAMIPNLLLYFDLDSDPTTGNSNWDDVGPHVAGWERRLELRTAMGAPRKHPWAYEVVSRSIFTPHTEVSFEQRNGWIRADGNDLLLKVPRHLLDLTGRDEFDFTMVDSWFETWTTVLRGTYEIE